MEEEGSDRRAKRAERAVGVGTSLIVLFSGRFTADNETDVLDILRDAGRCRVARAILRTSAGARKVRRLIIFGSPSYQYVETKVFCASVSGREES